ncbi:ferritin-like domain-containing protein [Sutcliffiella horikoshii]|uniref:ferritin family protein n=1 Tax=Sutcliffiella horikoshii TaxID=79883 RepID=UPI001CBDAF0D|nr:ferritin-like domain-containing protein [Sutcliffiella horikoshii]UAL48439.1 ferritin-like domain-containing protein [Sutcliffiella horikoshii]
MMNGYYYPYYTRAPQDENLIESISRAINGEYSAIACYEKLAQMAPDAETQKRITEIREDEIKHYNTFSQIYQSLTGKPATPEISEECKDNYQEGLVASLKDEQETVEFYLDIADSTQNPYIRRVFKRAAADEQNHAVWFLYFYTESKG